MPDGEYKINHATRIIAATFGIIFAVSGISHGFFEALQGNMPTNGLIIDAISKAYQAWPSGGESAFTLIPNFLVTGLAAIGVSLAIIVWSIAFLGTRHGATIFLLLFILLFLVGGGVAQVVFFTVGWAFATRIHQPLTGWRKRLPQGSSRDVIARVWPWSLAASFLFFIAALLVAIVGYWPGVSDPNHLLGVVFGSLGVGLILIVLSFVSGFADDLRRQPAPTMASVQSR